jgi:hypothetical protein
VSEHTPSQPLRLSAHVPDQTRIIFATVVGDDDVLSTTDWSGLDWRRTLEAASHNRVLYVFANRLLESGATLPAFARGWLQLVVQDAQVRFKQFQDTVAYLGQTLGRDEVPYLVVKTFKYLDYVTFDVDTLVPYDRFDDAIESLKSGGARILPHPRKQGVHQRNCMREGLCNIDLHRKFFWQGLDHIDEDYVWATSAERRIDGADCHCPSMEVDFLLHNKQLAYERYYVTILDFLAVKYAHERNALDHDAIENQVRRHRWSASYRSLLGILNGINHAFYGEPLFAGEPSPCPAQLNMPFLYPYPLVLRQLGEMIGVQRVFPAYDFAYYHFTFMRYLASGRNLLPYYRHWFDFSKLDGGS